MKPVRATVLIAAICAISSNLFAGWFPLGAPPAPLPGASVDANFATGVSFGGTFSNLFSVSNSLGGYATDANGNLVLFGANTLRRTSQGALIETTAATNLVIQNQFASGWSGSGASVNANSALSPDNSNDAMFLKEDTSTGGHSMGPNSGFTKSTTPGPYVFSITCARAGGSQRDLALTTWDANFANEAVIDANLQTGIVQYNGTPAAGNSYINKGALPLSNGYWLVYVAFNDGTNTAAFNLNIGLLNNSTTPWAISGSASYTGDGISGVYCFLPQIEAGTFPSSAIITAATQVTRPADVVTITGAAATALNAAQGTATIFTTGGYNSGASTLLDSNGTALLGFNSSGNLTDAITSGLTTANEGVIVAANDYSSVAWDGTGRLLILNGGAAVTDAVAQTPSATLHLGAAGFNGYVQRLALWTTKQVSPQSNFPLVIGSTLFGAGVSGPENATSNFPSSADWSYLASQGVKQVRLALAWENLQPTLATTLNAGQVSSINSALALAAANGICIILDVHNYAHYVTNTSWVMGTFAPGNGGTAAAGVFALGDGNLPVADLTDLWTRLATAFVGKSGLCGYDLMNEPENLASNATWNTAAQADINAIRAIDTSTAIYVSGDGTINTGGFAPSFYQPTQVTGTNLIYEAHQYWDYNPASTTPSGPGVYTSNYSTFLTTNYQGTKSLQAWLGWLKKNNFKGYLGEFNVPNSVADNNPQWLILQANAEALLAQQGIPAGMFFYGANNAGSGTVIQFNPQGGVTDPRLVTLVGPH